MSQRGVDCQQTIYTDNFGPVSYSSIGYQSDGTVLTDPIPDGDSSVAPIVARDAATRVPFFQVGVRED